MKESEAKKKICPIITAPVFDGSGHPDTHGISYEPYECLGSDCVMWNKHETEDGSSCGDCGLKAHSDHSGRYRYMQ